MMTFPRSGVNAAIFAVLLCLAVLPSAAHAAGCANEEIRKEQGAAAEGLPECRAYELVTPPGFSPNLQGAHASSTGTGVGEVEGESSVGPGAIAMRSFYPPEGSPGLGQIYVSRRGEGGWSTAGLMPPLGPVGLAACKQYMYFSADLSADVLSTVFGWVKAGEHVDEGSCAEDDPPLVAGEPRGGYGNLFERESESAGFQLVDVTPPEIAPSQPGFVGGSADMSHVVFGEEALLVEGAPTGVEDLYIWDGGTVRLVSYLPDGVASQGTSGNLGTIATASLNAFGLTPAEFTHSVSDSGEAVVFTAQGGLYVRVNAAREPSRIASGADATKVNGEQCSERERACTIQLDAVQGGSGLSGGGVFLWASSEDEQVFFSDENRLTPGATATTGKPDLYEYDLGTGVLSDLTMGGSEAANVRGVVGASEDGSYVYFVAKGVLTSGPNIEGREPVKGKPNLYVWHDGVTSFIATLSPEDSKDWGVGNENEGRSFNSEALSTGLVSRDGTLLAFNSIAPVTGYETLPAEERDCLNEGNGPDPCDEIFRYDAAAQRLVCVSCGAPQYGSPAGQTELRATSGTYRRRALAADGSVFFDTPSRLLAQDNNGVSDVYEWSPVGVGECSEASVTFSGESGGCLYSISSGTSPEPSYFVDASESGEDAYFLTAQSLVAGDRDNQISVYDARVNGGIPAQNGSVEGPGCQGLAACRPPAGEPPARPFAASATSSGPGDLVSPPSKPVVKPVVKPKPKAKSCKRGSVRKHGKCVKEKAKRSKRSEGSAKGGRRHA
jgi:hypothetical protein